VRLYRLTIKAPPHNLPPRYNICPTDPVDVLTERESSRDFVRMRWPGHRVRLVKAASRPSWASKKFEEERTSRGTLPCHPRRIAANLAKLH
jgi:putative SOS response-associated peptidase YedK